MEILLITPEIAPYSRFSPTGDSAAALPKALRGLGHTVTVLSPLWACIDPSARHLARRLSRFSVKCGDVDEQLVVFEGRSTGGVDLRFLANETLFPATGTPSETTPAAATRWGAFCRAAVELIGGLERKPDIVHVLGWQTAAIPLLMRDTPSVASIPTVLALDDVSTHGVFERDALAMFGIDAKHFHIDGVEFYGRFSSLKAGIQHASRLVAPSPTYAREGCLEAAGLEGALRARGAALSGILHGIDVSVWNAATDPHLESRFDPMDVAGRGKYGKMRDKAAFQKELGLPVRDDVPLFVAAGSVTPASAYSLLVEAVPHLMRNDVQLVVLADGASDAALTGALAQHAERWTDRVSVRRDADVPLVHRAHGAADLVIVPEIGGATAFEAMQAHRYGALPIGRLAGAFADCVVDVDAKLTSGTGFAFAAPSAEALLAACQRAAAAFTDRAAFRVLSHRAMLVDHSWERSARLHERVYRAAAQGRAVADAMATPA